MNKKSRKWIPVFLILSILLNLTGCVKQEDLGGKTGKDNTENIGVDEDYVFEDNDYLYENDDDTSVVTMYLTVSKGNSSENTDHTWDEINSYSVYDYEEMGVERYAVNGLLQVGDENGPLDGEVGYGRKVPNATVTIRGQTSSKLAQKNYKIELKDGNGEWNGQRVINLNKHQSDGLRFRNKLTYDLLEELPGMISLQTQFVHLYVKDETKGGNAKFVDYGLYTQVEQPNKSFLERHGLDKYGHLYKINHFEFYRYEDIIMKKNEAAYDEKAFEDLLEIKGDDDHSKLIATLTEVNDYSISIEEILEKRFDIDNLASWMAFQILMGNTDTQSRNTLIYSPLNDEKWYFISWDNDASLKRKEHEVRGRGTETGWECGISNYWGNVLFSRVLKSETFREKLDEKIEQMYQYMSSEKISKMANTYASVVKPYVFRSPDKYYCSITSEEYSYICKELPKEIEKNYTLYKESLEKPMPFFIGLSSKQTNGIRFTWDNAYDFKNRDVFYTFELADNYEFKNSIVSEKNIFVPGYEFTGKLKPGQYFIRVTAKNEDNKTQFAFDEYMTKESVSIYGVKSFYVMQDGSIEGYVNEE